MKVVTAILGILWIGNGALANVSLPSILGSNMVLQQKTRVAIWGKATPGEKVIVGGSWSVDRVESAIADADGHWKVKIKTPPAGGPFKLQIRGQNMIELKNIMSGEVWFAGGQSNMDMPLVGFSGQPVTGGVGEIAAADYPNIRLFDVEPRTDSKKPQFTCPGVWKPCSPEIVGRFSAIAYVFGKEIHLHTGVPVGVILSSVGGTVLETWIKPEVVENDPQFLKINAGFEQAKSEWISHHPSSELPFRYQDYERPGRLYNGMIAPLIPFTIKGAIWYQGESNARRGKQYQRLFPAMIESWRSEWGQGEFPFYYVQLASFLNHGGSAPEGGYEKPKVPQSDPWAELRNAQFMALSVTNTGMAVAIDLGEPYNIHPAEKIALGKRLSLWALAKDYDKEVCFSGPLYTSMEVKERQIQITFEHTNGGLVAKDGPLEGFAIAGLDERFVWADAVIDGDTVVVSSAAIANPVAVRYAWGKFPRCNLYNEADLPASPFRTDDWTLISEGKNF